MSKIELKEIERIEELSVCEGIIVTYYIYMDGLQVGDARVMELDGGWVHCDLIGIDEPYRNQGSVQKHCRFSQNYTGGTQ